MIRFGLCCLVGAAGFAWLSVHGVPGATTPTVACGAIGALFFIGGVVNWLWD